MNYALYLKKRVCIRLISFHNILTEIRNSAIKRLESLLKIYQQRIYNNMDRLLSSIRTGDVVLVEGRSEISRIIKLFTQSSWSHSALYIGDRLINEKSPIRKKYQTKFGTDASHLLIETLLKMAIFLIISHYGCTTKQRQIERKRHTG